MRNRFCVAVRRAPQLELVRKSCVDQTKGTEIVDIEYCIILGASLSDIVIGQKGMLALHCKKRIVILTTVVC